jgi:hypothetical protein
LEEIGRWTMCKLIRDYENPSLPLEKRLPSLAMRFPCLRRAEGLAPFTTETFYSWLSTQPPDTPAWHAGHLILNLFGRGPWERFDAVRALRSFGEEERSVFANWVRCWH